MLLLAVDTSGKNGSLALARASENVTDSRPPIPGLPKPAGTVNILELVPLAGRMYSAQLIPELQAALARQNLKKTDIGAYVVASGPGSFTGLRVGLSTVKALSETLHKPITAVSVLRAAARMAKAHGRVVAALDAGRQQVFVGDYVFRSDSSVQKWQESLLTVDEFLRSIKSAYEALFVTPDAPIRDAGRARGLDFQLTASPQADMYARIGWEKIRAGDIMGPEALEPNYLRPSDAELFSKPNC